MIIFITLFLIGLLFADPEQQDISKYNVNTDISLAGTWDFSIVVGTNVLQQATFELIPLRKKNIWKGRGRTKKRRSVCYVYGMVSNNTVNLLWDGGESDSMELQGTINSNATNIKGWWGQSTTNTGQWYAVKTGGHRRSVGVTQKAPIKTGKE